MKKITILFLALVLVVALPFVSLAWGKEGHEIVAEIAFSQLDKNTRHTVQKYLEPLSIEEASVWMDDMRKDPKFNYMKPWHYVNIEKGGNYEAAKEGDVINALNKAIDALEHKSALSDADIKMNLLIIFHLIGDLHMPLHAGYGVDKGGNTIQVKYLGNNASLHWVWDTEIIESEKITKKACLKRLEELTPAELAADKKIDVIAWMNQSRSYLDNVYDFKDNTIDQAYVDKNKPIVEDQLVRAGIRLAAVLDNVFKS